MPIGQDYSMRLTKAGVGISLGEWVHFWAPLKLNTAAHKIIRLHEKSFQTAW